MKLSDEQIATELHALRETPSEEFAAELDAWAAAGFPPREESGPRVAGIRRRFAPDLRWSLGPSLAVAASMLIALAVAVSVLTSQSEDDRTLVPDSGPTTQAVPESADSPAQGGDESPGGASGAAGGPAPSRASGDEAGDLPFTSPGPPIPAEELKPGKERVQEKSASMTLSTEPGEVDDVADEVIDVVDRYEGIVVSSNVNIATDRERATFDLRIPTANLQAALADLSDLASVSARNEGTLDITAPFVTAEERFEDAEAEVDALLDQLAEADSETEIASIREQLRIARFDLAAARAELGALKQRADFSVLSLTVVGDGDADGWSLSDAADDAVSVLEDLAGAGLVALAVLIPLGGVAILAWLAIGKLRRRQREKALD